MSEVVLRMEFHKNCLDCDLRQIVYGDSYADTDIYCSKENRLVGKRFGPAKDLARPSWCPIICVLPEQHGDLIDRDETFHAAQPEDCTDELWAKTTCGRVVLEAKTVIPATERSET